MILCADLALLCEQSTIPVKLRLGGEVALTVGRCQDAVGSEGWQVLDWRGCDPLYAVCGVRWPAESSYAAAMTAWRLLGADARRAITPVVASWRYLQLFPVGSSLEWEPAPLAAWKGAARPALALAV